MSKFGKLSQTKNVNNYVYRFHELQNKIPSMNLAEGYNLFMHRLNPQLHQLTGTLVTSQNLVEFIEVVKKAKVYGEDKGTSLKGKMKTNKKGDKRMAEGQREEKGHGT